MGAWGTAISSNDTYADAYGTFFDWYNDGLDVAEISKKLIARNQSVINDPEDGNNFWFALAKAQWECKKLDPDLLDRVKQIIENKADIQVWRQLGASEKDLKKRQLALDKFLAEIQVTGQNRGREKRKSFVSLYLKKATA